MVSEFYAVTGYFADPARKGISLYKITYQDNQVTAKKIRLDGHSFVREGKYMEGGNCLGIMLRGLQLYNRSSAQRVDSVNTIHWGGRSAPIIGLFFDEETATACFKSSNLQHWDKRFLDQTESVLEEIGPAASDLISLDSGLANAIRNNNLRSYLRK